MRCPDDATAALPVLLWRAALAGDARVRWLLLHRGPLWGGCWCRGLCYVTRCEGGGSVDGPGVVHLVVAKALVALELWSPTNLCVWQRRT